MRVSGRIARTVTLAMVTVFFALLTSTLISCKEAAQSSPSTTAKPQIDSPVVERSSTSTRTQELPEVPPESGHSYHAFQFLHDPERDIGKLVELDPWSVPVLTPKSPEFVTYIKLGKSDATVAGMVGLRYANDIATNVSVFDVRAENTAGDFMEGTDIITVGQIAVQISGPNRTPNPLRIWDVEPKGTIEGTTSAGLVVRIPFVRFWRYHDTHLDEPEPKTITIPPQIEVPVENPGEPRSGSNSVLVTEADGRRKADEEFATEYQFVMNYQSTTPNQELRGSLASFLVDLNALRGEPHDELAGAIKSGEEYHAHWVIDDRVRITEESLEDLQALLDGKSPGLALGLKRDFED